MKDEKIRETVKLQFEMIHLFHKNFAKVFYHIQNSSYSLNKNQNKAILIIGASDNIMPTTLGRCLDLQKGSLTTMIDALEKENLVYRKGVPEDRRKTLISLTEQGKEYREWYIREIERNASKIFERLEEDDINAYHISLQTMLDVLKKLDETA